MQRQFQKLQRRLESRLSSKGLPGLYVSLALLVLIAAAWVFGTIAYYAVTNHRVTVVDTCVSAWVQSHATSPLTRIMIAITQLHSTASITIMTLGICAYFWLKRLHYWVLTLLLAVFGGMFLNFLLKNLFLLPRPHFKSPLLTFTGYGFPSGHTMGATVLYGALSVCVVTRARTRLWHVLVIVLAISMIGLVGFSRIFLGAHYLSDVLAAIAEGLAWLAVCIITVETIKRLHDRNTIHQSR